MKVIYSDRIALERRLLAALFAWPTECDLTPEHFMAPAHQELYQAIQEVKRDPVSDDVLAVTYDDAAMARIALLILDAGVDDLFISEGGFFEYTRRLQQTGYGRADIPQLVADVRECPRCGH